MRYNRETQTKTLSLYKSFRNVWYMYENENWHELTQGLDQRTAASHPTFRVLYFLPWEYDVVHISHKAVRDLCKSYNIWSLQLWYFQDCRACMLYSCAVLFCKMKYSLTITILSQHRKQQKRKEVEFPSTSKNSEKIKLVSFKH